MNIKRICIFVLRMWAIVPSVSFGMNFDGESFLPLMNGQEAYSTIKVKN